MVLGEHLMAIVSTSAQTTIIFDLGGVLLGQSRAGFIRSLGFGTLFSYAVFDHKAFWRFSQALQDLIFAVCDQFTCERDPLFKTTYTPEGVELPYILCAYQAGLITSAEVLAQLPDVLNMCRKKGMFVSYRQELLAKRAIEGIFNAKFIANYIFPMRPGIELLKELSQIENLDGSKKFRFLALSNWDKESFAIVRKIFEKELAYFDGMVISADVGTIKPNIEIFEYTMERYHLRPEKCIFIDDQYENIMAAKAFGIERSIHYTDAYTLRKELIGLGILPSLQHRFPVNAPFVAALIGSIAALIAAFV